MRVYIINLKKILKATYVSAILILTVAITISLFNLLQNNISNNDLYQQSNADIGRVIIIDPGHGGEDPGAIGVNGSYEKDLNLSVAMLVGEMLKEKGYTVLYTRTEDRMLYSPEENVKGMRKISDLKNRCSISNSYENSLFISIHMNTYGSSKYSGLQVYYKDGEDSARSLATDIQSSVKGILQPKNNRNVKNGKSLYILENTSGTAVLIECGFLSNAEECEKLSEKEYQKQLSFSIVCGIINYISETDKEK